MPLIGRRAVIKTLFFGSALSRLASAASTDRILFHVQNQPANNGIMKVRISDFPVLKQQYGSARIGTSPIDSNQMPVGLFYPVLINRGSGNEFYALDTACSHAGCTVPTLDPSAHIIQCLCHGSQYAIDGALLRGPAGFGLRSYHITYDGIDELRIEIPDLVFSVKAEKAAASKQALGLDFLTFSNIDYQVQYRPSWPAEPQAVPFSLDPSGPFNQNVFAGIDDYVTLYVDGTAAKGFFEAAMRTKEV
jgi:Rieske Fe-S protein